MLYVVHLNDGDIHFERCFTFNEALEYIDRNNLCDEDCTLIHGDIHNLHQIRRPDEDD